MTLKARIIFSILVCLLLSQKVFSSLQLQEVRTASDHFIVLFYTSDTVNVNEVEIHDRSSWKVNGEPVREIYQFATQADECDHYIFLETDKLVQNENYRIETPYGDTEFTFDDREIFCESIKTNQVAYSALSTVRYANFAIWLGTGGSRTIEGSLPAYSVVDINSKRSVLEGELLEYGADTSSGDYVYRIDLSGLPEGGPYKIVVEGYGCSYPFGVGDEFSKELAYTIFRGQYLQRCGCPIEKPAIREKACHTLIYDVDGPIGEANIVVNGDEPSFVCYGGYHDAGDADRRAYHIINPIVNLMIYEAFSDYFIDGQYDIPGEFDAEFNILDYTNGIPDIIDEAEWGTLAWEYLQNEDGTVHFGTETKGYPDPFAAPMDKDDKKYGTVKPDHRATCASAGLFMHLARILQPYKPERSEQLVRRAELAMQAGASEMADPEKLYFHIQHYLLTGNEESHDQIKALYAIADSLKYYAFQTQGYSLNDYRFDNPAYIYSYIIENKLDTDPEIVEYFISAIRNAADTIHSVLHTYAYPVGNKSDQGGWGHNVKQAQYAGPLMLMWRLTGEQTYINSASQMMDYKLGLNPIGISYVTELGYHQVHNPHDRESAYTKTLGWGNKPGITVFGPGVLGWWRQSPVLPPAKELPKERQFVDDIRAIYFTEFTIFETMTHDAFYTVLAGGR